MEVSWSVIGWILGALRDSSGEIQGSNLQTGLYAKLVLSLSVYTYVLRKMVREIDQGGLSLCDRVGQAAVSLTSPSKPPRKDLLWCAGFASMMHTIHCCIEINRSQNVAKVRTFKLVILFQSRAFPRGVRHPCLLNPQSASDEGGWKTG